MEARYSRKKSTTWTGYKVHFTETCEADAPHLIVEVTPTTATTADGDIVGELHEHLAERELLPREHLMDMGSVDAEVLAESQSRYQVDIVGPILPDTSWASKEAGRFDHSRFLIDWQAKQVVCPAKHTSRRLGPDPRQAWKAEPSCPLPASTLSLLPPSCTMYTHCGESPYSAPR